ncbi:MAG: TRAP transporter small permease [Proteobacteria bacterium]|nr:TRAP transporter small permease [Pseudomonadota bacterium]
MTPRRGVGARLAGAYRTFVRTLNAAGSAVVFLVMAFITADIAGRVLFNAPLAGVPELSTMAIVSIVFLQVPHVVSAGSMIRSEMVLALVRIKAPRAVPLLEGSYDLVGSAAFAVIVYGSMPSFLRAFGEGDQYGTPGVFLFPQWPVRLLVILCCLAASIQFLISLAHRVHAVVAATRDPDGNMHAVTENRP